MTELNIRADQSSAAARVAQALAVAGHGLEGDRHASPLSPRQVLVASSQTYGQLQLPPQTLRQNLLVDFAIGGVASGDRLRYGAEVELLVMFACEPCGKLDRQRPGLASALGRDRGVLARVTRGGPLREGDAVRLVRSTRPAMSDDWRERVLQVLRHVPTHRWVTYATLATLAGVSPGYCRAFPRLISVLPTYLSLRARPASAEQVDGAPWNGNGLHDTLLDQQGDEPWN